MTNLSESSRKKNSLIVIHGLNNNAGSFSPLMQRFSDLGWETHFVTLPCHGQNRKEARDFKEAFACFDRALKDLTEGPYAVIAFSQGALYLQLWLEKRPDRRPLAQVLLAPALYIHRHQLIERVTSLLPEFVLIKSFSPRSIRRFGTLSIREYRILLQGLSAYQRLKNEFKIPTLLFIDPKDELVDAGTISDKLKGTDNLELELIPRDYLKKGIGCHHVIFHPDYFNPEEWEKMTAKINEFLKIRF